LRSAKYQRLFGSDDWSVRSLKAEGDCFYLGIQMGITTECTVESLRSMVAEAVDEATWEMYQSIKYCCDDYEWVCSCCSIDEARRRVCMDVPTAKRNKVPCVWADDFAIQTIANTLRIAVLIYNSEAQTESSRCLSILPSYLSSEEVSELDNVEVVLLLRTRRSHYNLIEFGPVHNCKPRRKLAVSDLPYVVRRKYFGDKAAGERTETGKKRRDLTEEATTRGSKRR
jgi:hypothetical protein